MVRNKKNKELKVEVTDSRLTPGYRNGAILLLILDLTSL